LADVHQYSSQVSLSPRQLEVMELRANGYINKQIAWKLSISEATVKEHVSNALRKLKSRTTEQAIAELFRRGIFL
jgi:DNA-binding CsgD family transcriptional regulator